MLRRRSRQLRRFGLRPTAGPLLIIPAGGFFLVLLGGFLAIFRILIIARILYAVFL